MKERFIKFFNKNYEITDKGKIKCHGKSVYPTNGDIILKFNQLLSASGEDTVSEKEAVAWIEELLPKAKAPAFKKIPGLGLCASWIYSCLSDDKCPYHLSNKGNEITYRNAGMEINADEENVKNWLWELNHDKEAGFTVTDIKASLSNLFMQFSSIALSQVYEKMKYDPTHIKYVDIFLNYLYKHLDIKEDYDIFNNLMKHWMWILKRRITNQSVRHHLWINFYGASGIGKTEMIHRMFSFMKDYVAEPGIQVFNDATREYRKFTDNFVLFFEELATSDSQSGFAEDSFTNAGLAAMKQVITADYLDPRIMGTQDQAKVKIRFTPISVANEHLYNIIFDETSMRRFFDFTCQRTEAPTDFTELNDLLSRFPDVLKGIDESNENGYFEPSSEIGKRVREIQRSYIPTKTSTNEWIVRCNIKPDVTKNKKNLFTTTIYAHYKDYCNTVGKRPAAMSRVETILRRLWPQACDENNIYLIECDVMDPTNNTLVHKEDEPKVFTSEDKIATFETPMDDIDWGL